MARYNESVCRLCRREGIKLFLKGDRCFKDSCAVNRRPYPPGEQGRQRRSKIMGYGLQLREKQKVKRIYGVLERQFRKYFKEADRLKGITGANLLILLESRLDNVIYKIGFAASRAQARQFVRHGKILVNGRCVDIPSFQVSKGDEITVKEGFRKNAFLFANVEIAGSRGIPGWLSMDKDTLKGRVLELPRREDVNLDVNEQLIVELYSK
ncbi:MAG: 30S ribosomal protein S4 [Acidobacteria bacterium]|nr:30S ribosomal protein S4 [Acidobacteriota bacterium]